MKMDYGAYTDESHMKLYLTVQSIVYTGVLDQTQLVMMIRLYVEIQTQKAEGVGEKHQIVLKPCIVSTYGSDNVNRI